MPARIQNICDRPGPRAGLRVTGPPVTARGLLTSTCGVECRKWTQPQSIDSIAVRGGRKSLTASPTRVSQRERMRQLLTSLRERANPLSRVSLSLYLHPYTCSIWIRELGALGVFLGARVVTVLGLGPRPFFFRIQSRTWTL